MSQNGQEHLLQDFKSVPDQFRIPCIKKDWLTEKYLYEELSLDTH